MLEEITGLYEAYLDAFHQQERGRKPFEGAFGFGGGPQSYPCHSQFAQNLEQLLDRLTAQAPSSQQAEQALTYIYFTAPARWKAVTAVYWMLLAVQGSTAGLIQCLEPSAAKALFDAYQSFYPRRQRLPAQSKILAALQKRGKQG